MPCKQIWDAGTPDGVCLWRPMSKELFTKKGSPHESCRASARLWAPPMASGGPQGSHRVSAGALSYANNLIRRAMKDSRKLKDTDKTVTSYRDGSYAGHCRSLGCDIGWI